MPVIRLPDGQLAQFPDDMPGNEIKAFVQFKFPDVAGQPDFNSLAAAQARLQFQRPTQQPGQQVEENPYASSLPGPLGQFQNTSAAFQTGMAEGMTGNLSNELVSGALAVPNAIGSAIQGNGFDVGQGFNTAYEQGQQAQAGQAALNPAAAGTGNLTGALALGSSLGGLSPMTRATTPLGMAGMGALEGATYGAVYGAGGAEGNDRYLAAARDAGLGAAGGALLGLGASAFTQPVSQESRLIARALERDQIDPASVGARVAALGPDARIADIGPNLQGQAAAIATLPGAGSRRVVDALIGRRAGANDRIKTGVDAAIGPAPRLSEVTGEIDTARQAINSQYEPLFRAKALSDDPFTDISPVVEALDRRIGQTVGGTKSTLREVKGLLTDASGNPIRDPQMIMAVRQELDGLIGDETNRTIKGALRDLRKELDNTLGSSVPGLKDVDAQFAEVARQADALERGGQVLNDGKSAIDPADLAEEMISSSAGQNVRLSQGVRADINRIIGTKANDRVALRNIVRGEGSWNADKLRQVFGAEKADELMNIIDREATLAATENLATSGSRTQVLRAAQDELKTSADSGILREAGNLQFGSAAGRVADKVLAGGVARRREGMIDRVAEALMAGDLTPKMTSELNRLVKGLDRRDKSVIAALLAGQASQ